MSNSSLVNYTKISPSKDEMSGKINKKITIHHMAGNLSVETCGNVFQTAEASANYGIGSDGRVGMYVEEKDRAWTSSSRANDEQAVTIEVANDGGAPDWHVSDSALAKLIDLCVDICQRNGISSLNYTGDTNGNLTRHNMFASTTCPGPYLQSKFPYIAEEVNKRLGNNTPIAPAPVEQNEDNNNEDEVVTMELRMLRRGMSGNDCYAAMVLMKAHGYYDGTPDDVFGPKMEAGLREMQAEHGLGVDGILGNNSWTFLLK